MPDWVKWWYDFSYRFSRPPWDSGITPPEVVDEIESGEVKRGSALDLGCGTGTNSIFLAKQGFQTVGVDFSVRAIDLARKKARAAAVHIDFYANDVTRLDFLRGPFDFVLDIGCFHSLDTDSRLRYSEVVTRLTCPGSVYMLYAFDPRPSRWRAVGITQKDVRRTFGAQFALHRLVQGHDRGELTSTWYWFVRK